ncbi:hypothetical protein [Microbacterium sp. CJ88]|uniref:hypothetical protein n=1 Tax=Microbacterium sp. CJ88 TaxID=3445672 RepID=UPI003F65E536
MTAIEFDAWIRNRNEDLRDVQLGLPAQVYHLLNARAVVRLRWVRQLRLERVDKAVKMKKRHDAPAEFEALVRSVHEIESQLRDALRAGRGMGMDYDPELDPEPDYGAPAPDEPRSATKIPASEVRSRRLRYREAGR